MRGGCKTAGGSTNRCSITTVIRHRSFVPGAAPAGSEAGATGCFCSVFSIVGDVSGADRQAMRRSRPEHPFRFPPRSRPRAATDPAPRPARPGARTPERHSRSTASGPLPVHRPRLRLPLPHRVQACLPARRRKGKCRLPQPLCRTGIRRPQGLERGPGVCAPGWRPGRISATGAASSGRRPARPGCPGRSPPGGNTLWSP